MQLMPRTPYDLPDLKAAREYLAALEALAHMGYASQDPREVFCALRVFAEPSDVLKKMASTGSARR